MDIPIYAIDKYDTNILVADTFSYELPNNFKRADLLVVDMILLYGEHVGGYVIEKRILDSNGNLIIIAHKS